MGRLSDDDIRHMASRVGEPLGENYAITEVICLEGGFADVYKVMNKKDGRDYVAKIFRGGDGENDFETEQKICTELKGMKANTHLVHPEPPISVGGQGVVILEYLEGPTLREYLADKKKGPSLRLGKMVLSDIATALETLHAHGYVHRDVKPENIKVVEGRGAVLIDFGIACPIGDSKAREAGTSRYAPPEGGFEVTRDIFSLGVVFHEAVTGRTPLWERGEKEGPKEDDILHVPREFNGHPVMAWVLGKCLEFEPHKRYQGAAAVRRDVHLPREALPDHRSWRRVRRMWPVWVVAALILLFGCFLLNKYKKHLVTIINEYVEHVVTMTNEMAKRAQTELETTQTELKRAQREIENKDADLVDREMWIENAQDQLRKVIDELTVRLAQLADEEVNLGETKAQLDKTEQDRAKLGNELAQKENALKETKAQVAEAQGVLEETKKQVKEKEDGLEKTRGEIAEAERELTKKKAEAEQQLQECKARLAETEGKRKNAQDDLTKVKAELEKRGADLAAVQRKLPELSKYVVQSFREDIGKVSLNLDARRAVCDRYRRDYPSSVNDLPEELGKEMKAVERLEAIAPHSAGLDVELRQIVYRPTQKSSEETMWALVRMGKKEQKAKLKKGENDWFKWADKMQFSDYNPGVGVDVQLVQDKGGILGGPDKGKVLQQIKSLPGTKWSLECLQPEPDGIVKFPDGSEFFVEGSVSDKRK